MGTADALLQLVNLATAVTGLAVQMQQIGGIVQKAQAEGRPNLTDAEWQQIKDSHTATSTALAQAILASQAKPA